MRAVILITLVGLAVVGILQDAPLDEIRAARSIEELQAAFDAPNEAGIALDARCGELDVRKRILCEETLAARFSSGAATPQSVLRLHCTKVESVWDTAMPEPPALCADRFGGWVSG